jgi:hypothetical protein
MIRNFILILFLLIPSVCFAETPLNSYSEIQKRKDGGTITIYSYPKYYDNNGTFEAISTDIKTSNETGWDWEVVKGVYKLKVKDDGTFEINHLGDVFSQRLIGIGFYNTDTKQRILKTNISLSNGTVDNNTITWSLPLNCTYQIVYSNNNFKDILTFSQQAKNYFKNNAHENWTVENSWVGLIYDMDLSNSTLIDSKDFDTDGSINFVKNGRVKHKIKSAVVRHSKYQDPTYDINGTITNSQYSNLKWTKKKIYKNGYYVEAIPVQALNSENGTLKFNTDITFQEGASSYSGTEDTYMTGTGTPDSNFGSLEYFDVARPYDTTWITRGLIKFDVSSISSTAIIQNATISVYRDATANTGYAPKISLKRCLKTWKESEASWNNWTTGKAWGVGGASNQSDDGTDNSANGSDYDRKETALGWWNFTAWTPLSAGFMNLNITPLVQGWTNTSIVNNGIVITAESANQGLTIRFWSSENTTADNRPKLIINYTDGVTAVDDTSYYIL